MFEADSIFEWTNKTIFKKAVTCAESIVEDWITGSIAGVLRAVISVAFAEVVSISVTASFKDYKLILV